MKPSYPLGIALVALGLGACAFSQAPALARLSHETTPEISRAERGTRPNPTQDPDHQPVALLDSKLSRLAAEALFVNSKLDRARFLAGSALQRNPRDAEALFVQMEAAGMQADDATVLDSAVRLCDLGRSTGDPRAQLAAVRVRELAANTAQFRAEIPRVRSLLANSAESWPDLNEALLSAAMDGVPTPDPYVLSRASGFLNDWRVVALGPGSLLDFDPLPIAPGTDLSKASYQNHLVENFQFPDGWVALPSTSKAARCITPSLTSLSLKAANWTINLEGAVSAEIFLDGERVLRQSAAAKIDRSSASFNVTGGPHRVLVKLVGSTRPWRISILPSEPPVSTPARPDTSAPELTYELAAEAYAAGDFGAAIEQINAERAAANSPALQFLLAQSWAQLSPADFAGAAAWFAVHSLAPSALAADIGLGNRASRSGNWSEASSLARHVLTSRPQNVDALEILASAQASDKTAGLSTADKEDVWARRLAVHPSCEAWQGAIQLYNLQGRSAEADAARQKLDGCAPESLDYAQALSQQGQHAQSAQALQRLLAAAPLNRAARLMLVRELQMAGDDGSAQRAAAEWLRVAPNAENYHRLGAEEAAATVGTVSQDSSPTLAFYQPYRRDAVQAVRRASREPSSAAVVLLDDHVAIARPDGSVSLYVHRVSRLLNRQAVEQLRADTPPRDAQVLELRLIHRDGSVDPIELEAAGAALSTVTFSAGDVLDEEYVMHYAGDGGIPEHSEVFQFVFGSFNQQVLSARFVALSPAEHADRGVVIATGDVPRMAAYVRDGMLARVWQKDTSVREGDALTLSSKPPAIVRLVEQENGWSEPSNAEHQRRIETIHPGPRPEDSLLLMPEIGFTTTGRAILWLPFNNPADAP